jgi:hypothetical protein
VTDYFVSSNHYSNAICVSGKSKCILFIKIFDCFVTAQCVSRKSLVGSSRVKWGKGSNPAGV